MGFNGIRKYDLHREFNSKLLAAAITTNLVVLFSGSPRVLSLRGLLDVTGTNAYTKKIHFFCHQTQLREPFRERPENRCVSAGPYIKTLACVDLKLPG